MELNFLGTVSVTRQVLPYMTKRGTGSIVTVSSVVGLAGAPLATGYSASKHALQVKNAFFFKLRKIISVSVLVDLLYVTKIIQIFVHSISDSSIITHRAFLIPCGLSCMTIQNFSSAQCVQGLYNHRSSAMPSQKNLTK